MKIFPYWLLVLAVLFSLVMTGCLESGVEYDPPDGDEAADGDDPTDGDAIPDGDENPDGDETPECTHLCDCPQGWFCNAEQKCEDGTGLLGTPFCCDNPDCPTDAPCEYANGDYGRCGESPVCNCNDFYGIYCPDAENTCEEVEQVRVTGGNDCSFGIEFQLADTSTVSAQVDAAEASRSTWTMPDAAFPTPPTPTPSKSPATGAVPRSSTRTTAAARNALHGMIAHLATTAWSRAACTSVRIGMPNRNVRKTRNATPAISANPPGRNSPSAAASASPRPRRNTPFMNGA